MLQNSYKMAGPLLALLVTFPLQVAAATSQTVAGTTGFSAPSLPDLAAGPPCDPSIVSRLDHLVGTALDEADLGSLHDEMLARLLLAQPQVAWPPDAADLSLFVHRSLTAFLEETRLEPPPAVAALRWWSPDSPRLENVIKRLLERFLRDRLFGACQGDAVSCDVHALLRAEVDRLVAGGCMGQRLGKEIHAFMDAAQAGAFATIDEFRAYLHATFGWQDWKGGDAVAARALVLVGTSSADYWTDPDRPGGEPPTTHSDWGEGAAADAVGGAIGGFIGGLFGAIGGGAAAGPAGAFVGGKYGAIVGGGAGAAGASAGVMLARRWRR